MFPYQDPSGTDILKTHGALTTYQGRLQAQYERKSKFGQTKFLPIQAFAGLQSSVGPAPAPGAKLFTPAQVIWTAYPKRKGDETDRTIDQFRDLQEEYVEWMVQSNAGKISTITFTTEFAAYYQALAEIGFEALVAGIKAVIPNANPTVQELYGTTEKPKPLTADGIVGSTTWRVLAQILDRDPINTLLQIGSKGQEVVWLQTWLTWLGLWDGPLDGQFNEKLKQAVIVAQKRYTGGGQQFLQNLNNNPWNNGQKGLLCMVQADNTLPLLFGLLLDCSVQNNQIDAGQVCGSLGGSCVPGRNSDPGVCTEAQKQVRKGNVISLADPVGIEILKIQGNWAINKKSIDNITDPQHGVWKISRNKRRAVLTNVAGLTLGGVPITSGAQVARQLLVGARVLVAAEKDVKAQVR